MTMSLRPGENSPQVRQMQEALNAALGITLLADGDYGPKTVAAVKTFQIKRGILADGVAGPVTLNALFGTETSARSDMSVRAVVGGKRLTDADVVRAAQRLGVSVAHIKTVTEVEARGSGFLSDGRPIILFERHVFYKQIDAHKRAGAAQQYPDICNPKRGGYIGLAAEWKRLERAQSLDSDAALESCSWGLFQIMGYHWKALGFSSVFEYVEANQRSEGEQLDCFVRFLLASPKILQALRASNWALFARLYNGPAYRENQYDVKLAIAFRKHARAA